MIQIEQLEIRRNQFCLQDISLQIPQAAYAVFTGPSGSGKTTILETVAGLLTLRSGKIKLNGIDVTESAPANRRIGYVPQDLALFPWMTVQQNLSLGLKKQKGKARTARNMVAEVAEQLHLSDVLNNRAGELSRGQAQRVAIGRALVAQPEILIMDEPLSSIDGNTKKQVIGVLANFHAVQRPTVLHVTHHADEIEHLYDVRFELRNGKIVAD